MRKSLLAAALLAPQPAAALPAMTGDVTASSTAVKTTDFKFRVEDDRTKHGRAEVGVSLMMDEGRPLEFLVWGGGGAILGSLAGPAGAALGAAAGAAAGLLFSTFVEPRTSPKASGSSARGRPRLE